MTATASADSVIKLPYKTKYVRVINSRGRIWASVYDISKILGKPDDALHNAARNLPWIGTGAGTMYLDVSRVGDMGLSLTPEQETKFSRLAAWCRESLPAQVQQIEDARARVRPMADDYRQAREPSFQPAASIH